MPHIVELLFWGTLGVLLLSLLWHLLLSLLAAGRRGSGAEPLVEQELSVEKARQLLAEGSDPQELLLKAVWKNKDDTVRFLLESGASPDAEGEVPGLNRCCSVLEYAVSLSGNALISAMLLRAGARADGVPGQWSPLHLAAVAGRESDVAALLASGAEVDARDALGCTPLMMAAFADAESVVRLLLAAGADAEARSSVIGYWYEQWTPLLLAASQGSSAAVRELLVLGAQVDGRGGYDQTPLMLACKYGHVETARILLEAGADPNARDNQDNVSCTPLLHAYGNAEIEALLVQYGAKD